MKRLNYRLLFAFFLIFILISRLLAVISWSSLMADLKNGGINEIPKRPKIERVEQPYAEYNLRPKDQVVAVNDVTYSLDVDVLEAFYQNKGETVKLALLRDGKLIDTSIHIAPDFQKHSEKQGIYFVYEEVEKKSIPAIIWYHLTIKDLRQSPLFNQGHRLLYVFIIFHLVTLDLFLAIIFISLKKKIGWYMATIYFGLLVTSIIQALFAKNILSLIHPQNILWIGESILFAVIGIILTYLSYKQVFNQSETKTPKL